MASVIQRSLNTLELGVVNRGFAGREQFAALQIKIDGRCLIERLRYHELPYATREGSPGLAGNYGHPRITSHYLQGIAGLVKGPTVRFPLFNCECELLNCWPLLTSISIEGDRVYWRRFENRSRSEFGGDGYWDYGQFGSFCFERSAYEAEISRICASLPSPRRVLANEVNFEPTWASRASTG